MPFTAGSTIAYEVVGHTAYLSMQRPDTRNALDEAMMADLIAAIEEFGSDDGRRVLILSGSDCGAFCAGGDLKAFADSFGADAATPLNLAAPLPPLFVALERCPKPVVAAVDGYALGGGLEMALACDIRMATTRSSFGLPEPRAGLLSEYGLDVLSRLIPLGEALNLQLSGSRIDAQRAYQIGLVQTLADDRDALFAAAEKVAESIAKCAPAAVRAIKHIVRAGRDVALDQARALSAPFRHTLHRAPDALEGARAFAERRSPAWVDS